MIGIVDYGVGNLASIQNMLKRIGSDSSILKTEGDLLKANKVLLPGVGAFDTCAEKLESSGLLPVLSYKAIEQKVPILGICVGCQLLMESSEEGKRPGLGWIKGVVKRFNFSSIDTSLKIPHMGWSDVRFVKNSKLYSDQLMDARFYFVHSYHVETQDPNSRLLVANYGYEFTAGVEQENIMGVQFHPEKSHRFGMELLSNFLRL